MADFLEIAAWIALAAFLAGCAGGVLGGLLVWWLLHRSRVEPADIFDAVEEETVEVPVIAPVLADRFPKPSLDEVAWPLAGEETVPIKLAIFNAPTRIGHRPDDVAPVENERRVPPYMLRPDLYPTVEFPQLGSSPPRFPTGEYELLGEVSG